MVFAQKKFKGMDVQITGPPKQPAAWILAPLWSHRHLPLLPAFLQEQQAGGPIWEVLIWGSEKK